MLALILSLAPGFAPAPHETLLLTAGGGTLALSSRGPSAFRVRFLPGAPVDTPMVHPDAADAPVTRKSDGISAAFGALALTAAGDQLELHDAKGKLLTSIATTSRGTLLTMGSDAKLYGRGGGKPDATQLTATTVDAFVDNTRVYAPHYWSTDGYSCLAVTNVTTGSGKTNVLGVSYSADGAHVTWTHSAGG
eukprot:6624199-Prymnesium_polylepis.1